MASIFLSSSVREMMRSERKKSAAAAEQTKSGKGGAGSSKVGGSPGAGQGQGQNALANLSDKELKEHGNKLYNMRKYEEAIKCYNMAILKNARVAYYFTNRALCQLKLGRWDSVCQDCRRALDLDASLVKGHYFLGQALMELESYDDAIKHLQRAMDLAKEQKLNFGDDVAWQLRAARKKRWNQLEEKRLVQEIELQAHLNRLLREDRDRQTDHLSKGKSYEDVQDQIVAVEQQCDNYMAELNALFAKVDERCSKREVPDFLCGKISFEILREPVITPSGVTYERKDIEEHLHRVGHFDPVTRVKLTQDQLVPNLAMKEVVDSFLVENEWALDY